MNVKTKSIVSVEIKLIKFLQMVLKEISKEQINLFVQFAVI